MRFIQCALIALLWIVLAGSIAGCGSSHVSTDAGESTDPGGSTDAEPAGDSGPGEPTLLPAQACAPECVPDGPEPPPPGIGGESACYDGCNWCLCTTAGPINCTSRLCEDG